MSQPKGKDPLREKPFRRDPYEVLEVPKDATLDQIKSAYRRLALKLHPDKNANDPEASAKFQEVAYSYSILSDPEKRRRFDLQGFDGADFQDFDDSLDLSNLGVVNTALVAFFSKLGVPIKTSVSSTVLKDAIEGTVTVRPLPIGRPISGKVEKQQAQFFSCTVSEEQSKCGLVIRAHSPPDNKFKLLYFEQDSQGCLSLVMQESSVVTAKNSSAGFYFLGFQVFSLDPTVSPIETARDPQAGIFRKLDSWTPQEVSSLRPGTHIFAIYGDNFFRATTFVLEASIVLPQDDQADPNISPQVPPESSTKGENSPSAPPITPSLPEKLKEIEAAISQKRKDLTTFEMEYRQALAKYLEVEARLKEEKNMVEHLISTRNQIHESFSSGLRPVSFSAIDPNPSNQAFVNVGPTNPSNPHIFPSWYSWKNSSFYGSQPVSKVKPEENNTVKREDGSTKK